MLDTHHRIATPEGVELSLRLAGPVARALAWLLDFVWRFAVFVVLNMAFSLLGKFGFGLMLLSAFALEWIIPAWFEAVMGATPGKRALGLRVLSDDGTPVQWRAAFTRNLLRAVDFLPFAYLAGLIVMLVGSQFKRLGDVVAGTLVVYDESRGVSKSIPQIEALLPLYPLKLEEQRVILDFAERSVSLSAERVCEMALLAGVLVDGCQERQAVERLIAYANYYAGRKPQDESSHASS